MTSPKTHTTADLSNDSPLADRIAATAHKLAYRYGADADDVQSEITLAILERYADGPEFLDNATAYVVSYGAWRARDALKRECRLDNRTVAGDAPATDDGDATILELQADDRWQQVEFGFAVEQALETLDKRDRQIARMYAAGYSAEEIGDSVGCARRTVYYHLNGDIAAALEAQGLAQFAA